MLGSECASFLEDSGCAAHGRGDCLCDVPVVKVPITHVPNAVRLAELGADRFGLLAWAEELLEEPASQNLRLVAEG